MERENKERDKEENKEKKKELIDHVIDFIFSKTHLLILIVFFVIGLILRSIAAVNIGPNADEMVHGTHALGIIASHKLQIMDQDPVWFYLTDFFYKTLGQNLFGLRFASVLFGSLSIIVVYLIARKLFNKRTALISSFILTLSAYHIIMSLAEMDTSMIFFILLSIFFLIKAIKENKDIFYMFSFLYLGIAIMIKQIALTLIPVFIIFVIYYKLKNKEFKLKTKHILYFVIILFIIVIPILTFNYLLYKDKGLVDLQFSRFLGIGKDTYQSIESTIKPFKFHDLFFSYENHPPGLYEGLSKVYYYAPIILILGLIGIIISYLRNKEFTILILLSSLIPFIFLSGTSLLPIHFVFIVPLFSIFSANTLDFIIENSNKIKIKQKTALYILLLFILISSLFYMNKEGVFRGKNEITNLIEFKKENIDENSLVIVDSRTYRGRIALALNDRHYLESNYLSDLINNQNSLKGDFVSINTYFIECVTDDCGWGTILSQPDFNASSEYIVEFFKNNSKLIGTINDNLDGPYFNVYNSKLRLKQESINVADSTHQWFYYPLRYNEVSFDDYQTKGFFNKFLDKIAHYILYIEIIIAILTPLLLIYLLFKEKEDEA